MRSQAARGQRCRSRSVSRGADKLGQRVIQIVLERILTPEHVAHICAELQERLGGGRLEEEIAELDGRIVGVRRSLAHLLDVVEQGGLAAVAVERTPCRAAAELTELEAQARRKRKAQAGLCQDYANQLQRLHPSFVLQHVATMRTTRHHTAARRRALMRDGTALRFPPPRIRAYGGRAWPGRSRPGPLSGLRPAGTPHAARRTLRGTPTGCLPGFPHAEPDRFGPLPDLPPAGFGMTRSAQVGAPTGGTPAFIPRPVAGLPVVRCLICGLTRIGCHGPSGSPACRFCRPQPERFHQVAADYNRHTFNHHPPNGKSRTGRLLLLRKTQVAVAVAAAPAGCLQLRPEFCSAQAYAQGGGHDRRLEPATS